MSRDRRRDTSAPVPPEPTDAERAQGWRYLTAGEMAWVGDMQEVAPGEEQRVNKRFVTGATDRVRRVLSLSTQAMRPGANGGQLKTGGIVEHLNGDPAPGPTPAVMRMKFRRMLDKRLTNVDKLLDTLEEIVNDKKTGKGTKIMAIKELLKGVDTIGKYSGTASVSLTDGDGNDVKLPAIQLGLTPPE